MMKPVVSFVSGLALAAGAAFFIQGGPSPARAQPRGVADCPTRFSSGASLTCYCPAAATAEGSVWGADVYTDDSGLCRAALHAGVIGASGGTITARETAGRDHYDGVDRNGVASADWGQWRRSFTFEGGGGAGLESAAADDDKTIGACPLNARDRGVGDATTCACSAAATQAGSVWGSGPYTADSIICRAAVHAGVITTRGGTVRVRVTAGQASYAGSSRNGVDAGNWGSYDLSYMFER